MRDFTMSEEQDKQLNIGKKLKDARVANGLTLDDLQQATKIQKRYLIAIEDEKFDELPGDFYVRAFIKQYANTVGLNGNELLQEYDDYLPKTKTEDYSEHLNQAVETRRDGAKRTTAADRIDGIRRYLPTIIVSLIVIIVLAAIWVTAIARNHKDSSKIDSSSVSVSGESSKKKASSSSKKKTKQNNKIKLTESSRNANTVAYRTSKPLSKNTDLQISTTGSSTNSVNVDGRNRLNQTMVANDKKTVVLAKNANTVTIRVSNARVTKIKIGNQTLDFTDNNRYPATRVITITFGGSTTSSSSSSNTTRTASQNSTSNVQNNRTVQNRNSQVTTNNSSVNNQRTANNGNQTNNRQ